MHALIIDKHAYAKLEALRFVAEANVTTFQEMYRRAQEFQKRGGQRQPEDEGHPDRTVKLRVGYAVTFTIEEHRPGVPCRHVSVSGPNRLPAPQAVEMLMKTMGFHNVLLDCKVWTEQIGEDQYAVNVLEPMRDEDWASLMKPIEGALQ